MTETEKAYQYFVIAVPESEEQAKAYFWARRALQPTLTPLNEPLTLEELREMGGEPVWCEWLLDADRRIESGAWFIVVVGEYGLELKKPLDFGCYVCKNENYETEWLAYRHPPEGEEDKND